MQSSHEKRMVSLKNIYKSPSIIFKYLITIFIPTHTVTALLPIVRPGTSISLYTRIQNCGHYFHPHRWHCLDSFHHQPHLHIYRMRQRKPSKATHRAKDIGILAFCQANLYYQRDPTVLLCNSVLNVHLYIHVALAMIGGNYYSDSLEIAFDVNTNDKYQTPFLSSSLHLIYTLSNYSYTVEPWVLLV